MVDKTKWLLVNYTAPPVAQNEFPLGLAYISSTLKSDPRLSVQCLDLINVPPEEYTTIISKTLIETGAGVVGWAGYSDYYEVLRDFSLHVRRTVPDVTIVVGGAIVSSDPLFACNKLDMDYGVCGEGEETVLELASLFIQGGSAHEIAGLVFRGPDGQVIQTPTRSPSLDIDAIPWPDWEGFNLGEYIDRQKAFASYKFIFQTREGEPRLAPLLLSRSCPFPCTFCMHSVKKYRARSIDKVFDEINFLVKNYNITGLSVMDDLFAVKHKRVTQFCQGIAPYNLTWGTQVRAEMADPDMLGELQAAGCRWLSYGFESYDTTVLNSMRKKIAPQQIERASRLTYEKHITVLGNFLFSDPAETVESINNTVNWWARNRRYSISLNTLLVYPGTELYRAAVKMGKVPNESEYYKSFPILNLTNIPDRVFHPFLREMVNAGNSLAISAHITGLELEMISSDSKNLRVSALCPHCGEAQIFTRVVPLSNLGVACHTCRGRFILSIMKKIHPFIFPAAHADLLHQAVEMLHKEQWAQSDALARQVIAANPSDFNAHTIMGTAHLRAGNFESAIQCFRKAVQMECSLSDAQNNYGVALCATGQLGAALLRFLKAMAIDPNNASARANAEQLGGWIGHHCESIPFIQIMPEFFTHNKNLLYTVPQVRSVASSALWPPLRTSESSPFSGSVLAELLGEQRAVA